MIKKMKKRNASGVWEYTFVTAFIILVSLMTVFIMKKNAMIEGNFIKSIEATHISKRYEQSYKETRIVGTLVLMRKTEIIPEKFLVKLEYEHDGEVLKGTINSKTLYDITAAGDKVMVDLYEDTKGNPFLRYTYSSNN